jgi:L-ascorbate metabolism protein UlaG (beta-lactamase superfamily)
MVALAVRRSILPLVLALVAGAGVASAGPISAAALSAPTVISGLAPAQRVGSAFRNLDPAYHRASPAARFFALLLDGSWLTANRVAPLTIAAWDPSSLRSGRAEPTVTWIGHSTVLVQLDGVTFLTDPIWSGRSGPFSGRIGVRRYTPPGVGFDALPRIDFVLISHDHYDHLDEATVRRLARKFDPVFVVPLGIKAWLADRQITNAVELNWGESVTIAGLRVVCTPAQHGSGRTLADQGRRLWASWAVLGSKRFYFAGDTGYSGHFEQIGEALGPFDLAALPIGSYTPPHHARPVHISPEEALQASLDLQASKLLGIHWGTFALGREPYDEPPRRVAAESRRLGLDASAVRILKPGEIADL